uniref:Glutamate receptor 1 n=1 Tax=Aceria tosichella TaxID=561515 RepID=A0A6G1SET4_9ACAR
MKPIAIITRRGPAAGQICLEKHQHKIKMAPLTRITSVNVAANCFIAIFMRILAQDLVCHYLDIPATELNLLNNNQNNNNNNEAYNNPITRWFESSGSPYLIGPVSGVPLPEELRVGGLFERGEENAAIAFRLAIERLNVDRKLLPKTRLVPIVEIIDKSDSFAASRKVCNLLQQSLVAIFGPQSSKSSNYARSVCAALQMPHFETRWDTSLPEPMPYSINLAPLPNAQGRALRDLVVKKNWKTFAIVYSEDSSMILIQEILKHTKMHSKHIIVRKAREAIVNLPTAGSANLAAAASSPGANVPSQTILINGSNLTRQTTTGGNQQRATTSTMATTTTQTRPSFREILKELYKLNVKNMIIDVPRDQVLTVLSHANDVNMLRVYNSYIFTTLDLHTVDLKRFYYTGTNISAFSIIDSKQLQLHEDILRQWEHAPQVLGDDLATDRNLMAIFYPNQSLQSAPADLVGTTYVLPADGTRGVSIMQNLTTEAALLFDGVELIARALMELNKTSLPAQIARNDLQGPSGFPLTPSCARRPGAPVSSTTGGGGGPMIQPWSVGSILRRYMQMLRFEGLTGEIKLHERGHRAEIQLQLHDLTREGLKSVAKWTSQNGLNYVGNYSNVMSENYRELLKNKTLIIVTLENKPYVMKVPEWQSKTGNDRWEGYCVDLIRELSQIRSFKYELRVLEGESASHGTRNEKGEWNGLIRELIDGKADIAVADLTITYERESVVDFTMPFMSLGIGILVKKPTKASPKLFEFMLPLAPEVWIYLITAFVGVTLFLFMVARFSPYEWQNPHPCTQDAEELSNDFTMKNTLWFTIGCLMQQGCDIMPGALSTRVMAAAWWFFILIIVSSYTANLAAFLTVERMDNPIQSADDLAKQTKVLYGCLKSGSTRAFFQRSNYTTYARMWSFMESRRAETLLDSNSKGVERVKKGDFAFLMESTTIEYTVERNCDLSQVGSLLDQKGYGIATQQDSPYRAVLSEAILTLQEKGVLHRLKDRWWKERKDGNTSCEVKEQQKSSGTASELGLDHVGGVFVVLVVGALISVFICLMEYYWKHIKTPSSEREHMFIRLAKEFREIFLSGNKRPIRNAMRF